MLRLLVALCLLAAAAAGWQTVALRHARVAHAAHLADDARAIQRQQAIAQAVTDTWRDAVYGIAFDAETRRLQREADTERTIAGIRSGTVRLRDRFTCPAAVPDAAAGPGGADDAAQRGLRPADAEFLVRFADQCDAVVDERNAGGAYVEAVTRKREPAGAD